MNELHKKEIWINPNISYMFSKTITEYDMREAGFSLIREYQLLPKSEIDHLRRMNKEERHVKIGKIQRDQSGFTKILMEAFADARQEFYAMNHLSKDDIISIKKDAICTSLLFR